ncbi:MAG: hypothetical protein EB127_09130 [Alphaproteobacteria bacterium]|nr:hypothetical protein [Alphaproteobacteria bacterium]
MRPKIFVQIASYRDPELIPTIKDCLAKAKYPERLTFGICWQRDETESLDEFKDDPRFQIIDIPWNKSNGLCWARSLIQKLWKNEKYTMQLDSHHRFLQDWDEHLIKMMKLTGSKKPIITAYAGMYSPKENKLLNVEPYKMVPNKFTEQGTILFYPCSIPDWEKLDKPIPARFVSGHFYFTLGIHCKEYKYDPNIYFAGDEISLSIRSYTLGYDLFHPHYTVIWHEYTREGRTKHWSDFNEEQKKEGNIERTWWEMDMSSKRRLRHMLQEEDNNIDLGEYGLGDVRTHHDYELYAGINFRNRRLHPDAKDGVNPPINDTSEWYVHAEQEYNYNLAIPQTNDFKFIYIGIEDETGKVLFRQDLTSYQSNLSVNFISQSKPYKWIYWPVNKAGEWYDRRDTILND